MQPFTNIAMIMQQTIIHILDITGSCFAFLSTVYYVRANILAWPVGLIAICINLVLYGLTGIYGDMSLEVIYFVSSLYGWYQWSHKNNNSQQQSSISNITLSHAMALVVFAIIGIFLTAEYLLHFTNSQVPYWDATTTILSLVAQWLTCKKIIQTWFVWFTVDALYVGLYIYKGIPAHSILLIIYLGLAIAGYLRWYKLMDTTVSTESEIPAKISV